MRGKGKAVCALLLVQLLAWGVFVPTADAGKLFRLSAQFRRFATDMDSTTAAASSTPGAGGIQVYTKSVSIPAPASGMQAVVFVTVEAVIYAPGDPGGFSAFSCTIDAAFCNPGQDAALGYVGWVLTEYPYGAAPLHTFQYTWCAKVSPGAHTATVRMASLTEGSEIQFVLAHFFIDRTELKASTADDCELGAP